MHKPSKQSICINGRTNVVPAHVKPGQCALVITKNRVMGQYITNVLSLRVSSVYYTTSGIDALKEITSSANYTILITDLLVDEISGIALGIVLKEKRPAFVFGINNANEACKAVAVESGFDMVYDAVSTPAVIYQCFKVRDILSSHFNGLIPYPFVA